MKLWKIGGGGVMEARGAGVVGGGGVPCCWKLRARNLLRYILPSASGLICDMSLSSQYVQCASYHVEG